MTTLMHFPLCPLSRSVRIALTELKIEAGLVEERPWDWRPDFLVLNPAGELPVLAFDGGGPLLCGTYAISEYLGEISRRDTAVPPLFPGAAEDQAEVRRLVDWFHGKLHREVTRELLEERVYAYLKPDARHVPNADILRPVRANLRYHLGYVNFLANQRRWLAGEDMSFADMAAAAHLCSLDYLGEVPWDNYPVAKTWYMRMKSRPAFRSILADRIAGPPPPDSYADLDF